MPRDIKSLYDSMVLENILVMYIYYGLVMNITFAL